MKITLPWPPSTNTYWRHTSKGTLISRKGREYRQRVQVLAWSVSRCAEIKAQHTSRLAVKIYAHPPDRRRRDLDNILKSLLDAMQHGGLYEDDSQIDHLTVIRCTPGLSGAVTVEIQPIGDQHENTTATEN